MDPLTSPAPQPCQWVLDTNRSPSAYTRPLVGSEAFTDTYSYLTGGGAEVCHGVNFSSSLDKQELHQRARKAFERLRFHCPSIAASVEAIPGGKSTRSWVYTPVQDDNDREEWLQRAFVFEDKGDSLDVDAFITERNLTQLPYVVSGRTIPFRCYLLAGSGTYALYFHGPHHVMDGWPTLFALSLMFEWMSTESTLDKLEWGSEWKNLPPDPITATGGPRPTWDKDGVKLFAEVAAIKTREVPCLTLGPPVQAPVWTEQIRHKYVFNQADSLALVNATKANGFSITHLLEAAHCLALPACKPVDLNAVSEIDFSAEMTIASLERDFTESINKKTHFVTAFSHIPVRIPIAAILRTNSEKERLLQTMHALKSQYEYYTSNPCLPHLLAALMSAPPIPRRPPFGTLATNLGVVEARLPKKWRGSGGETVFDIKEMCVGHRARTPVISIHSWSFNGCLYIQVQASDMWKDSTGNGSRIRAFIDEMVRQARIILPNSPEKD
ncbi:hypothetical protein BS17DRAFT_783709 [Gyrodon lividus]|nr:hypothetical protein BS17DRAFT_783709 [Gyrodon lividus]